MKPWGLSSLLATRRARSVYIPPWPPWSACWVGARPAAPGRLAAQEALVLLTALAHNLLAWTRE